MPRALCKVCGFDATAEMPIYQRCVTITPNPDAPIICYTAEILAKSPTAIKLAKVSFNAETEHIRGIGGLAMAGLALYYDTEESAEGTTAFQEKRTPDFGRFRK